MGGAHSKIRLLLMVMVIILLAACKNEISEIRALTDARSLPVQTSYNAEYTFTEKGRISNKLIATQLNQYEGELDYIEASHGFTMVFFDSLEVEEARLQAVNGRYNSKEKKLIAWEKVELYNVKGDRLDTEELVFRQDSGKVFTDKYVTISLANGSVIHGKGLESNESFTKYKIVEPHNSLLYLDKKTDTTDVPAQ